MASCTEKEKLEGLAAKIITPKMDREITAGETIYFEGTASGGRPPYGYTWNFGLAAPENTQRAPGKITFDYEGVYKVSFTVNDSKDNIDSDYIEIIVIPKSILKPDTDL